MQALVGAVEDAVDDRLAGILRLVGLGGARAGRRPQHLAAVGRVERQRDAQGRHAGRRAEPVAPPDRVAGQIHARVGAGRGIGGLAALRAVVAAAAVGEVEVAHVHAHDVAAGEADLVAALGQAHHHLAAQLARQMGVGGELDGDLGLGDRLVGLDLDLAELGTGRHAVALRRGPSRQGGGGEQPAAPLQGSRYACAAS